MKTSALCLMLLGGASAAITPEVAGGFISFREKSPHHEYKAKETVALRLPIQATIAGITEATVRVHLEQVLAAIDPHSGKTSGLAWPRSYR